MRQKSFAQKFFQSIIQWSPLSGSGSLFVNALLSQEWLQAILTFPLLLVSGVWASYSVNFVARSAEILSERGAQDAETLIIALASLRDSLDSRLHLQLSGFENKYLRSQLINISGYNTEGLKNPGAFIPMLEEIFIPLALGGEDNSLPLGNEFEQDSFQQDNLTIWDILAKTRQRQEFRHIAIVSWGGFGKTTLLKYITYIYAKRFHRRYHAPKLLPVLLRLREWDELIATNQPLTLPTLITSHYIPQLPQSTELNPPPNWAKNLLRFGEVLVMLDGFDEVPKSKRNRISNWINEQTRIYPQSVFILTSRPTGYKEFIQTYKPWTTLFIQPFNAGQRNQFIQNWYLAQNKMAGPGRDERYLNSISIESAEALIRQINDRPELQAMVANPILLTLISTFHYFNPTRELPRRRAALYGGICKLQLSDRPAAKSIDLFLPAQESQQILQRVALEMMLRGSTTILKSELLQIIDHQLREIDYEISPQAFLQQITTVSELLVELEPNEYAFAHRIFQEYLSAQETCQSKRENLLLEHINEAWWRETILLYATLTPNSIDFIHKIVQCGAVSLAYDCLKETTYHELNDELYQQLHQANTNNRYKSERQLTNIIKTIEHFLSFQNIEDLLTISQDLQWTHSGKTLLDLSVINILRSLEPVSNEIHIYAQSVSRASKLSALARANKILQDLSLIIETQKTTLDAKNISKIIDQWQQIITQVSGLEGYAIKDMPVSNPYVIGNPVIGELFVGREDILRRFEELWSPPGQIPSIVLYGHRRMGKTSILRKLPERFNSDYIIDFNMQLFGHISSTGELLYSLAIAIYDELSDAKIEIFDEPSEINFTTKNPTIEFNRFLRKINTLRNGKRFIITIDEFEIIEELIKDGKVEQRLLEYWRALIHTYPWFILVLAGLHKLNEMARDYWNPLFCSVEAIPVSFISSEAVTTLVTNPSPDFNLTYEQAAIDLIYFLTSGQPYLVQLICHNLVSYFNDQRFEQGINREFNFTVQDIETVINMPGFYRDGNAYFNGVWRQTQENNSQVQTQILKILSHHPLTFTKLVEKTNFNPGQIQATLDILNRHDVVDQQDGSYAYKIELLRRWVLQKQANNPNAADS